MIGTLVVRTYGSACESSLSSGRLLVFIMEAPCVLCEVRTEYLCEYRVPSHHRWLMALLLALPFQIPPPTLRAYRPLFRGLFLLPRPLCFLEAVPLTVLINFYEDLIMSHRKDSTQRLSRVTWFWPWPFFSTAFFFLGTDCSLIYRRSSTVREVPLLLNDLIVATINCFTAVHGVAAFAELFGARAFPRNIL